jgi:outer membrane receptor protein involved in Fe transport
MTMKRLTVRTRALVGTTALCLVSVLRLPAQTTAPETGQNPAELEDTLVLSPFVVEAEEDSGYVAKNTLAGTRIRTELRDVGSAVSVVTKQFLQDTGARNTGDLLVYTTNTEVGGISGNFVGAGTGAIIDGGEQRRSPQTNTRVRGLANADNTRDFFLTDIPWDAYIVGRVDMQRGPNAILFGIGSPAGIVNSSINQASFKDENTVEVRMDNYGSIRGSLDVNKVIVPNQLALRIAALDDETKYRQEPAYNHDKRVFGAVQFDPEFLSKGSARTSIKLNYEDGSIDANRPRVTPPVDAITPWFTSMNRKTYSATTVAESDPALVAADPTRVGALNRLLQGTSNPNYQPWIDGGAGGQIFDQPVAVFGDPFSGNQQGFFEPTMQTTLVPNSPGPIDFGTWQVYRGIQPYNVYAQRANLPGNQIGGYKAYTLADRGVFDFYNNLIDGPNKSETEDFRAMNATLSQTFLNNRVGFEVAYDKQEYSNEQRNTIPVPWLTVDVMDTLADGRANPNVGRAMVVGAPNSNSSRDQERETWRATAFGELNFKDFMSESKLSRALGRHVFTALWQRNERNQDTRNWYSYVATPNYRSAFSQSLDSLRIPSVHYLSGNLANTPYSSANINRLNASQIPMSGSANSGGIVAFNSALRANATLPYGRDDVIGWEAIGLGVRNGNGADRESLINNASKVREIVDSQAFIWQAYLFDGVFVPTVGYRKDIDRSYDAGVAPTNADQSRRVTDPTWTLPTGADDPRLSGGTVKFGREEGESLSWSMVLHTPKHIKERMPLETELSFFYNRSDNFQPAGGRTDVFGGSIASPKGKTKDYGFVITTWNDKLSLKVNWYETSVTNASLDGGGVGNLSNVYMVGFGEHWGRMFANWALLGVEGWHNNNYARVVPSDPSSALIDPSVPMLVYEPAPGQSVAAAKAAQDLSIQTLLNNPPPANFASHWNIAMNQDWSAGWGGYQSPSQPSSLAVTGDTQSKGLEFEINAQPTKNWNIVFNASKTTATRNNLAGSFVTWVESRKELYDGPAGDVRLWGPGYGGETVRSKWTNEFYGSYRLYRLLEGADVPELRPWRFNVITNYSFDEGRLRGVNVGGAYRWQDKQVIGFPITDISSADPTYDINRPWYGPAESSVDMWVGYQRKLTNKVNWRIQLNVRNLFGDDGLIPVTAQPDGSTAAARIPEPTVWSLTNTFKF